ncbi:hypothetical protein COY28_07060, partial [Candidatus Woesearchaeota archaeon CG_4_10_14_0_2_um_filter_57_5]
EGNDNDVKTAAKGVSGLTNEQKAWFDTPDNVHILKAPPDGITAPPLPSGKVLVIAMKHESTYDDLKGYFSIQGTGDASAQTGWKKLIESFSNSIIAVQIVSVSGADVSNLDVYEFQAIPPTPSGPAAPSSPAPPAEPAAPVPSITLKQDDTTLSSDYDADQPITVSGSGSFSVTYQYITKNDGSVSFGQEIHMESDSSSHTIPVVPNSKILLIKVIRDGKVVSDIILYAKDYTAATDAPVLYNAIYDNSHMPGEDGTTPPLDISTELILARLAIDIAETEAPGTEYYLKASGHLRTALRLITDESDPRVESIMTQLRAIDTALNEYPVPIAGLKATITPTGDTPFTVQRIGTLMQDDTALQVDLIITDNAGDAPGKISYLKATRVPPPAPQPSPRRHIITPLLDAILEMMR